MKFQIKEARELLVYPESPKPCDKAYREEDNSWYIDINSLEELMELVEKEGELVISNETIIIYNDYLE